jgi:ATP-binding cassette subfamily B protein
MGQWQRIALARAFLRDADLLILDEPTSALDMRMQQEIIGMLKRAAASRAALVVSHRPEMLAWAQRVIVLRAGEVVEAGSVDALRQGHGEFARLFNLSEGGDAP